MAKLTHVNQSGQVNMVDVGDKAETERIAVARGYVTMRPETLALIRSGELKKGDISATARIAGIMAAKRTAELIPLCHPIPINKIDVDLDFEEGPEVSRILIEARVRTQGKTGVEMEALTAVSVAALTIYDMAKAVDRGMELGGIRVVEKRGGQSGDWILE